MSLLEFKQRGLLMNKIKYAFAVSLLATGVVQASAPCEGFEIKIKNNLADDLIVREVRLQGADIQRGGIHKLNHQTEETFTVSRVPEEGVLKGEFIFDTLSLPTKEVRIQFNLENKSLICEHTDYSPSSILPLSKTRLPGKVHYTIG